MIASTREPSSSRLPSALALKELFTRDVFRPVMGLSPLEVAEYFKDSGRPELLAERRRLLVNTPEDFVSWPSRRSELGLKAYLTEFGTPNSELTLALPLTLPPPAALAL